MDYELYCDELEKDLHLARALLATMMQRAYMRLAYQEADEIAEYLGIPKPTDHELEDLR